VRTRTTSVLFRTCGAAEGNRNTERRCVDPPLTEQSVQLWDIFIDR
jgi:hypothetical protein